MKTISSRVYFVGAGPGDPELITVKGQRLISQADVIIYAGSLVNPAVLGYAHPDAECYDSAGMELTEQIALMRSAVRQGKSVVRLHTGDPSVYGAIMEQMRALDEADIPYQIVPGVTSAFAAAASLGIEYTVPGDTQTLILSRLSGRTPVPESESLARLAAHRSSMVFFLSTGMIGRVVDDLRAAGYAEDTPIAVVFRASWPDERVIRGQLADIAEKVQAAEITHQALIVVSPALREKVIKQSPDSHLYGSAFALPQRQSTTAIITLTRTGTQTGLKLLAKLPDAILYAPERFITQSTANIMPYTIAVRQVLQSAFAEHSALVCIMASGIVVRELAPVLRSKHHDPAVVVMDALGNHAVSLLSGHSGGANQLAQVVAATLGGVPVLTTASDVQGLPAFDLLGAKYNWLLGYDRGMTMVSAALVNGDTIGIYQDAGDTGWLESIPVEKRVLYPTVEALQADKDKPSAVLIITYRHLLDSLLESLPAVVVYHPRCLVVGVGCNRGTPASEIIDAIEQTLTKADLAVSSIHSVASIDAKADERGLLAACDERGWAVTFFGREAVSVMQNLPNPSEWAQQVLGVPGVAEPSALLGAGTDKLLVEKRRFANVTVAVALLEDESR